MYAKTVGIERATIILRSKYSTKMAAYLGWNAGDRSQKKKKNRNSCKWLKFIEKENNSKNVLQLHILFSNEV